MLRSVEYQRQPNHNTGQNVPGVSQLRQPAVNSRSRSHRQQRQRKSRQRRCQRGNSADADCIGDHFRKRNLNRIAQRMPNRPFEQDQQRDYHAYKDYRPAEDQRRILPFAQRYRRQFP